MRFSPKTLFFFNVLKLGCLSWGWNQFNNVIWPQKPAIHNTSHRKVTVWRKGRLIRRGYMLEYHPPQKIKMDSDTNIIWGLTHIRCLWNTPSSGRNAITKEAWQAWILVWSQLYGARDAEPFFEENNNSPILDRHSIAQQIQTQHCWRNTH